VSLVADLHAREQLLLDVGNPCGGHERRQHVFMAKDVVKHELSEWPDRIRRNCGPALTVLGLMTPGQRMAVGTR
jgi:hypothetical protein